MSAPRIESPPAPNPGIPFILSPIRRVLDLVYPPYCPTCGLRLGDGASRICQACGESLTPVPRPRCAICGAVATKRPEGRWCESCPPRPIHFDSARAATLYHGPAAEAVRGLKFRGRLELAPLMAGRMAVALLEESKGAGLPDAIVPVPLHWSRKIRRGFNQSERIGRRLGALAEVRFLEGALARVRRTTQQTFLEPGRRKENVEGAFGVVDANAVRGQRILLVDDVFTTGATANECARTLREAGAAEVSVLTFARA